MINFDIVGGCNAKCPLCVTARTSFGKRIDYISVADFSRTLDRLLELRFAIPGSKIGLYNWGEPILHPDLNGISNALRERGLFAGISTNASKKTTFTESTEHFYEMVFSVPGWSQASYDKIHGLKFERVIANIEATVQNMRATGYKGQFTMSYHTYQFNVFEMVAAANWCAEKGIYFKAYSAFINDYEPAKDYLQGTVSPETWKYLSKTVLLNYVDDLVASQPKDWTCPQWNQILTLSHKSEVLLCCTVSPGHESYSLGSIFDMSAAEIIDKKLSDKECSSCMKSGLAYWVHNPNVHAHIAPPPAALTQGVAA